MLRYDIAVLNGTVVFPYLGAVRCDVGIRDGRIAGLTDSIASADATVVVDARDRVVLSGAVDSPFHIVTPEVFHSSQDFTPFAGMRVRGWPTHTAAAWPRGVPGRRRARQAYRVVHQTPRGLPRRRHDESVAGGRPSQALAAAEGRRGHALWYQVEPSLT